MFNITLKNLSIVESFITGIIESQGNHTPISDLSKQRILEVVDGWINAEDYPSFSVSRALIEDIAEIIYEFPSYSEAKEKAYDEAVKADEFEKELKKRIDSQISSLKVKLNDEETTSDDIKQEIFGECDHLELMLEEINYDHENYQNFPGDLRDIQNDAIQILCEYFDC